MNGEKKRPFLFAVLVIVVAALEAAVIYATRVPPVSAVEAPVPKKVSIHICGCRPAPPPPEPVAPPKPPEKVQPPKPEPKPKPAPKPKPKPAPKPKPKPKPVKKKKPVVKKRPTPPKRVVQKRVTPPAPTPKTVERPKAPARPAPVVRAPRKPVVAKVDTAAVERAKAAYLARVRAAIEAHKYYPRISRKMRQTGTVEVQFTILPDGSIQKIELLAPCRYRKLNKAAVQTLKRIGKFPPIPPALRVSELSICVPIRYTLK